MKTTKIEPHKSSLGMDANIASLVIFIAMAVVGWIPYLGWVAWVVPLVFFFMEKNSGFVKFQAVTALVIGIIQAALAIIFKILYWITIPRGWSGAIRWASGRGWGVWMLFSTLSYIISVIITVIIIFLIIKSYGYKQVELPVIGPIATKASKKLENVNFNQN